MRSVAARYSIHYCNSSLITSVIGDCCLFSDISISLGSVATRMKCSRTRSDFTANILENIPVKEFSKLVDFTEL